MKTKMTILSFTLLLTIAAFGQASGPVCNLRSAMGAYGYSCWGPFKGSPSPPMGTCLAMARASGMVTEKSA